MGGEQLPRPCPERVQPALQLEPAGPDRTPIPRFRANERAPPGPPSFPLVLPPISPSLAASWLLTFSLSLDDFIITAFVTGPGATTLPLLIYSSVKLGVNPEINALGTLIIATASLVALTATLLRRRTS